MKGTRKSVFFIAILLVIVLAATAFAVLKARQNAERARAAESRSSRRSSLSAEESHSSSSSEEPGSVAVTFTPPEGYVASEPELLAAEVIVKMRMISRDIVDYQIYADTDKQRILVRFPWKKNDPDFDPEQVIRELGEIAMLTFREGDETDALGQPLGAVILDGKDIAEALTVFMPAYEFSANNMPAVSLTFSIDGTEKFAEATERLVGQTISIWMDDTMLSAPIVNDKITDGQALITGNFTIEEAKDLADKINAGALPFELRVDDHTITPPKSGD